MNGARYAVYYTPPPDSPLARFGARVLGYDCFSGEDVPQRAIGGIEPSVLALATVQPRRYGFHATLVAPFRLGVPSESDLVAAFTEFALQQAPLMLGMLRITAIGNFVVLRLAQPFPEIEEFAGTCVEAFDRFRAPLSPEDRTRRWAAGLTPRQAELMERWGYPYVLDEFRFHMTLAGPLPHEERKRFEVHLEQAFGHLATHQVELDAVSLMRQEDPGAAFRVLHRHRLNGK
jgi:putative phosphonate metabolism protein